MKQFKTGLLIYFLCLISLSAQETDIAGNDMDEPILRSAPIPQMRVTRDYSFGFEIPDISGDLPPKIPIGPEAEKAIEIVKFRISPQSETTLPRMLPERLPEDAITSGQYPNSLLNAVLNGPFKHKQWDSVLTGLQNLIHTGKTTPDLTWKIRFYQGQAYYFLGDFKLAFASFSVASTHYYKESRKWLDNLYAIFIMEGN